MEDEKTTETPVAEKPEKCLDDVKINERVVVYRLVNGENRRVFAKVIKKRNRSSNAQSGNANDEGKEQEQTAGANESEPKPADEMEYLVHFDGQDRRLDQWITYDQFVERAPRNTNGDGGGCDLRLTRKRRRENDEDIPLEELGGRNDHHRKTPPEKNIESIIFGSYEIQCWYYSPYRVKRKTVDKLFVCENCLLYSETRDRYACHLANDCRRKHPPGDIIYEEGDIRVYEVFGALEKLYCQLLCLLAKLFIDHKTLSFDVENFIFYLLCEVDSDGVHIAGMFSKEMYSANNLACIMTLPCYQRKGYGNLMIQLSYEMSKRARYAGTPERPFSDLGEISYKKYWLFVLLEFFDSMEMRKVEDVTLDDLEALVGINKDDIRDTMEPIGLVSHLKGGTYVVHNPKLDQESAVERPRPPLRRLVPQYLMWNPRNFDRPKRRN